MSRILTEKYNTKGALFSRLISCESGQISCPHCGRVLGDDGGFPKKSYKNIYCWLNKPIRRLEQAATFNKPITNVRAGYQQWTTSQLQSVNRENIKMCIQRSGQANIITSVGSLTVLVALVLFFIFQFRIIEM